MVDEEKVVGDEHRALKVVDKAVWEEIKPVIDDVLRDINVVVSKSGGIRVDDVETDRHGRPIVGWDGLSPRDILVFLSKLPPAILYLKIIETNYWGRAEVAKMRKEEKFESAYQSQSSGTETSKKSFAYLASSEERHRELALRYAWKRISELVESLKYVCDKWSRTIELFKIEQVL